MPSGVDPKLAARLHELEQQNAALVKQLHTAEKTIYGFQGQQEEHDKMMQEMSVHANAQLRRLNEELANKTKQLEESFAMNNDRQMRLKQNCSRELAGLRTALRRNIAREMRMATEGRVMEKVSEKWSSSEARFVAVFDSERLLKWGHPPGPLDRHAKVLELDTVLRITFGDATRATILFPKVPPWLSFSLYTIERSYDFICQDEISAQCFVLALGRLCPNAAGRIDTRSQFLTRKGWSKVIRGCQQLRETVPHQIVLSCKRTAVQEGLIKEDPQIEKAPHTQGASPEKSPEKGATCFASGKNREWPKSGENWIFNGVAKQADIYSDSEGRQWVNQLTCISQNGERRMVTIVTATPGKPFLEITGTGKQRFVKGWLRLVDNSGAWILEKAPC